MTNGFQPQIELQLQRAITSAGINGMCLEKACEYLRYKRTVLNIGQGSRLWDFGMAVACYLNARRDARRYMKRGVLSLV